MSACVRTTLSAPIPTLQPRVLAHTTDISTNHTDICDLVCNVGKGSIKSYYSNTEQYVNNGSYENTVAFIINHFQEIFDIEEPEQSLEGSARIGVIMSVTADAGPYHLIFWIA